MLVYGNYFLRFIFHRSCDISSPVYLFLFSFFSLGDSSFISSGFIFVFLAGEAISHVQAPLVPDGCREDVVIVDVNGDASDHGRRVAELFLRLEAALWVMFS